MTIFGWYKPLAGLAGALGLLAIIAVGELIYHRAAKLYYDAIPVTYWIEYHRLELSQSHAVVGEPVYFISYGKLKRPIKRVEQSDTLFCAYDRAGPVKVMHQFPEQAIETVAPKVRDFSVTGLAWAHIETPPKHTGSCYARSVVTIFLPYGITKTHPEILSPEFRVEKETPKW